MASKRLLKKNINNLTYELVAECFTYRHFHPDMNNGINQIIQDVVKTRNELVARVNQSPKDKKELRSYLNTVLNDMRGMVNYLDNIDKLKK